MQTSNPSWQRQNNLAVLTRAVWQNPGISRRDLAERFLIDKSSISRLIQLLMDLDLVESAGLLDQAPVEEGARGLGGRRRIALRIKANFGQVWGLSLFPDHVHMTVLDAQGNVRQEVDWPVEHYSGDWDGYLQGTLAKAAEVCALPEVPLLGLGFAVPGWVDYSQEKIMHSFSFEVEENRPLRDLTESTQMPIIWENDANCGAWSCHVPLLKDGVNSGDIVYVLGRFLKNGPMGWDSELGLGFGLVISGALNRGWRFRAGEFRSALWKPGLSQTFYGVDDAFLSICEDNPEAFEMVAEDLVRNLQFVSDFLDPRYIFFGGDLKRRLPALTNAIKKIGWEISDSLLEKVPVTNDEISLGAAQLTLDELFQIPSTAGNIHPYSLFRGYGTGMNDPVWRGLQQWKKMFSG